MKALYRINDLLQKALLGITGTMVVIMFTACIVQILFRYVFRSSLMWSEELGRYMLIGITFLGAAIALHQGKHICIDFIVIKLPEELRRYINIIVNIILLIALSLLTYNSLLSVQANWVAETPAMRISLGLIYINLPLGFGAMILDTLCSLFGVIFKDDNVKLIKG